MVRSIATLTVNEKVLDFSVSDEGIGIPDEDQKHLFDRFFRASNVTNIEGTGLGLNIVKKYLEMLDGEISFVSKLYIGTTFNVSIPNKINS
jgi:signal transduction histidine kinase